MNQSSLETSSAPIMDSLRKNFTQQTTSALLKLIENGSNPDSPAELRQALIGVDETYNYSIEAVRRKVKELRQQGLVKSRQRLELAAAATDRTLTMNSPVLAPKHLVPSPPLARQVRQSVMEKFRTAGCKSSKRDDDWVATSSTPLFLASAQNSVEGGDDDDDDDFLEEMASTTPKKRKERGGIASPVPSPPQAAIWSEFDLQLTDLIKPVGAWRNMTYYVQNAKTDEQSAVLILFNWKVASSDSVKIHTSRRSDAVTFEITHGDHPNPKLVATNKLILKAFDVLAAYKPVSPPTKYKVQLPLPLGTLKIPTKLETKWDEVKIVHFIMELPGSIDDTPWTTNGSINEDDWVV